MMVTNYENILQFTVLNIFFWILMELIFYVTVWNPKLRDESKICTGNHLHYMKWHEGREFEIHAVILSYHNNNKQ